MTLAPAASMVMPQIALFSPRLGGEQAAKVSRKSAVRLRYMLDKLPLVGGICLTGPTTSVYRFFMIAC